MWAGWKIIIHQNDDGIQEVVTYYITKDGIKISSNSFDFIYHKAFKTVIIVNHKTRTFYLGTFDDYKSQLKDLYSIDAKRADEILPMSYLLRLNKLLEQNISDNQNNNKRITPSLKVENTNEDKRLADYTAKEYKVYLDTTLIERIWLSQDVHIKYDIADAFNFFRGDEASKLKESKTVNTQEYEQLSYRGFPLKIINLDSNGFEVFSSEVVLVQELELDEEETFSPPATYQSKTLVDIIMAKD